MGKFALGVRKTLFKAQRGSNRAEPGSTVAVKAGQRPPDGFSLDGDPSGITMVLDLP